MYSLYQYIPYLVEHKLLTQPSAGYALCWVLLTDINDEAAEFDSLADDFKMRCNPICDRKMKLLCSLGFIEVKKRCIL